MARGRGGHRDRGVRRGGSRCGRTVYRVVYGEVYQDLPLWVCACSVPVTCGFVRPLGFEPRTSGIKSPFRHVSAVTFSPVSRRFVSPLVSPVPPGLTSSRELSTRLSTRCLRGQLSSGRRRLLE